MFRSSVLYLVFLLYGSLFVVSIVKTNGGGDDSIGLDFSAYKNIKYSSAPICQPSLLVSSKSWDFRKLILIFMIIIIYLFIPDFSSPAYKKKK